MPCGLKGRAEAPEAGAHIGGACRSSSTECRAGARRYLRVIDLIAHPPTARESVNVLA